MASELIVQAAKVRFVPDPLRPDIRTPQILFLYDDRAPNAGKRRQDGLTREPRHTPDDPSAFAVLVGVRVDEGDKPSFDVLEKDPDASVADEHAIILEFAIAFAAVHRDQQLV